MDEPQEKIVDEAFAEEVMRIDLFLTSAFNRLNEQKPVQQGGALDGELARVWRVSQEKLEKLREYFQARVAADPAVAKQIKAVQAKQVAA